MQEKKPLIDTSKRLKEEDEFLEKIRKKKIQ